MIPFIKPYYDEEDFEAVKQTMQSGWVAQGPKCEEFEEAAAEYLNCKYTISVSNCTTALYLALMALGIGEGDEVIVPDFTFPATALAVLHTGAKPVLVDVCSDTYNISLDGLQKKVTIRTKAIIPVHLFGLYADMRHVMKFAKENDLFVIEDAACSLGTMAWEGIGLKAGTIGDIGCFSFQASKGITTGEGGLICTNNKEYADRMRRLSSFGDERTYRRGKNKVPFRFDKDGLNYKMSDITSALALSQLRKIQKLIDWRVKIAKEWDSIIDNDPFLSDNIIHKPNMVYDNSHIYQSYVCVCRTGKRKSVMNYLAQKGFSSGIGTHACSKYPDVFGNSYHLVSSMLHENAISLPRYYGLEVEKEWYGL